jgi:esterase/lipase superfamily enzyme
MCNQLGEDIAEIAALARRIEAEGLLQLVTLDPIASDQSLMRWPRTAEQQLVVGLGQHGFLLRSLRTRYSPLTFAVHDL